MDDYPVLAGAPGRFAHRLAGPVLYGVCLRRNHMKRWICLLLILVCLPVGGALGEETLRVVDLNVYPEAVKLFSSRYPDVQLEGADTLGLTPRKPSSHI